MSMIEVRLQLKYSGFALDVDLHLPGRGVTALYGHSGSGKTTCLRCIAGLERAEEGFVQINDEVWQDSRKGLFVPPHKRALGYVFQEASLFPHLSVLANLEFGLKRIPRQQRRVEMSHATELLGIGHLLDRHPQHLSGGERQRIGIARALLTSPSLLLMDEPLAALDSKRKSEILPYLERLHDELEIPVLYVSHAQDEVARLADHIVLLSDGKALASGPIGETLARLDLPMALGDDAGVVINGTVSAYDEHYQLLTLQLPASQLQMRVAHAPLALGKQLRFKIQARDVSLSLQAEEHSSILNRLPVTVTQEIPADNAAHVLVSLDAAGTPLLARITRYSRDQLQLHPGQTLWAQIKAVAVLA
ncbi:MULTISPECIES: molybdenum ABC transporter ATP-binding protein [unclassified Pseudomonas]|uniref:molybdenum ABC transporter ATP-binding protein n=1 Tax=unclassified Pseudomonas TaxID=196821 RepID=UPI000C86A0B9|nr:MULTISPECIES: molybdenum ABC transporter ATP-binding protein [unclassified Pseudomonas]PMU24642.1 molybdenum ABC transporter ATP-binding protein [Pseudomonas sp. GP01-A9]PMU29328.1 molybdenum ABC transporter ATP-binding protein [Pseudomonas sp. GP01-A13]PMU41658.1 molybdenum ABC transporter ATP-binding protein [Pseudomonas sp. GP01-A8]PMU51663.1 molybdenum ABC transporter ATP-binding protein [Pseudomonas sp. GP01-A14]PMU54904.1 molybdenum ABC transporter ATP-binding protein [Pseudomonas sp.